MPEHQNSVTSPTAQKVRPDGPAQMAQPNTATMASPLSSASKKTVDLSAPGRKVSRIRRDPPPPPPRKVTKAELRSQEARVILAGLALFGLILAALILQGSRVAGASLSNYTVVIEAD